MLTWVTLVFIVLLCGTDAAPIDKRQWVDIDRLIHLRELFNRDYINDNAYTVYTSSDRKQYLRCDYEVKLEEEGIFDPDIYLPPLHPDQELNITDQDNDGRITYLDQILTYLAFTRKCGYNWDLHEFLWFMTTSETKPHKDYNSITANSFFRAESNFVGIDITDDELLSEDEFKSEYKDADYNGDGVLKGVELRRFRPISNIPITKYCSDIKAGCKVGDFLKMFKEADVNNDSDLDLKEYVVAFGEMIDSE
ncbi:hypothetical protein SNE40_012440 [Patella caerulea]|uniref:EF-hand domain-containing protein n=1 Tax=Patella caerulea TaxID=87958 RepID=A0AAN8PMK0_PATCE